MWKTKLEEIKKQIPAATPEEQVLVSSTGTVALEETAMPEEDSGIVDSQEEAWEKAINEPEPAKPAKAKKSKKKK
jgi:hypothetical protein